MKRFFKITFLAIASIVTTCVALAFDEVTSNFFLMMLWLLGFGFIAVRSIIALCDTCFSALPDETI